MITALFLIGFIAFASAIVAFYALKAPVGYEDDTGFHYDRDQRIKASSITDDIPAILRLPWLKPALGVAAAFSVLLFVSSGQNEHLRVAAQETSAIKLQGITARNSPDFSDNVALSDGSSRIFQTLCQRFGEVE